MHVARLALLASMTACLLSVPAAAQPAPPAGKAPPNTIDKLAAYSGTWKTATEHFATDFSKAAKESSSLRLALGCLLCLQPVRRRRLQNPARLHLQRERRCLHLHADFARRQGRRLWQAPHRRQCLDVSLGESGQRQDRLLPRRQYLDQPNHHRIPLRVLPRQRHLDRDGPRHRTEASLTTAPQSRFEEDVR
jgi:hypothetical protein